MAYWGVEHECRVPLPYVLGYMGTLYFLFSFSCKLKTAKNKIKQNSIKKKKSWLTDASRAKSTGVHYKYL